MSWVLEPKTTSGDQVKKCQEGQLRGRVSGRKSCAECFYLIGIWKHEKTFFFFLARVDNIFVDFLECILRVGFREATSK